MFGSENVHSVTLVIDADPGGSDEIFYLRKMPKAVTIKNAYMVSEQTQNAGTAVKLQLENWGTAGTAAAGTPVVYVGGTASASRLTARTPSAGSVNASYDDVAAGEWLVVRYAEEGAGWIANDRFTYQVDYVFGLGA